MGGLIDLTGQKFGKLTVLRFSKFDSNYSSIWECLCECGNTAHVHTYVLRKGYSKSCGCSKNSAISAANKRHGMIDTRFYHIWQNMKNRCINTKHNAYKHYGERGITVCNRWLKFENFYGDMYESYQLHVKEFGEIQTSIDRIDSDGNYESSNCRWATQKEQNSNRRNNRKFKAISYEGIEYISNNQTQFAKEHKLQQGNISLCLNKQRISTKGWVFEYI